MRRIVYVVCRLLGIAFDKYEQILMRFTKFASGVELSGDAQCQRSDGVNQNCVIVKMQSGVLKSLNRCAVKISVVAALVADIADDKRSESVVFQSRAALKND